jgi:hypothetical protein
VIVGSMKPAIQAKAAARISDHHLHQDHPTVRRVLVCLGTEAAPDR